MSEYKLVPVEPTEEMLDAGIQAQVEAFAAAKDSSRVVDARHGMTTAAYRAMLAAAPANPAPNEKLPPLPEPFRVYQYRSEHDKLPMMGVVIDRPMLRLFTADQMTAYGTACWNAALAWAAKECQKVGQNYDNEWNRKLGYGEPAADAATDCAAAVLQGRKG